MSERLKFRGGCACDTRLQCAPLCASPGGDGGYKIKPFRFVFIKIILLLYAYVKIRGAINRGRTVFNVYCYDDKRRVYIRTAAADDWTRRIKGAGQCDAPAAGDASKIGKCIVGVLPL